MYPDGFATRIVPEGPAIAGLEDRFRPHFFGGVATVQDIRDTMTLCLILMWIGLVAGIELARAALPALADRFQPVVRTWQSAPLLDRAPTDQLLAALGILVGLFMLGMFFGMGKPGQILSFLVFESAKEKQKLRLELGGQGGSFTRCWWPRSHAASCASCC
jgi:hypothetical protein